MRVHALGSIAPAVLPRPAGRCTPKLSFNAASYALDQPLADGRRSASRVIPTLSLDSAWTLERETTFFGRDVRQTLEPRLFYVNTPYRRQRTCPISMPTPKDFNFDSIFTENAFSGVDRVSDSNQLTAGVTTRVLDPDTGAEALRLGMAQRYRFRDQRITPDGPPLTQRFSDLLRLRLDDARAALDLRRLRAVQPRQPPHRALAGRRAAIRRARSGPSASPIG